MNQDEGQLKKNNKDVLIAYIIASLRLKLEESEALNLIRKRVEIAERELTHAQQYTRRAALNCLEYRLLLKMKLLKLIIEEMTPGMLSWFRHRKFADEALHLRKKISEIKAHDGINVGGKCLKMYLRDNLYSEGKYVAIMTQSCKL